MRHSHWFLGLVAGALALGCPGQKPPTTPPVAAVPVVVDEKVSWRLSRSGVGFRLSQAEEDTGKDTARVAETTPLDEKETAILLARLPALKAEPEDTVPFALRAKSLPPPRPGETVKEPFPPPPGPPLVQPGAAGPLRIERALPKGPIPIAPHLTVTFSQPMVPVTSHTELARLPIPVRLTPTPRGAWRWLGTQTVMFQPDPRFPMATEYAVEIPAGTRSMSGGALAQAERFTFTTPPAKLLQFYPEYGPVKADPVIFMAFDQAIDPGAMLAHIQVTGAGSPPFPMHLATTEEVESQREIARLVEKAEKGRWLAIKPDRPLPLATGFTVTVMKGAPSAEGPLPTRGPQSHGFGTYGPMRLGQKRCGWDQCRPGTPFTLSFSNPIALGAFDKKTVTIDPPVSHMSVTAGGNTISIQARTRGRTRYTVRIKEGLRDTFGQTLVGDVVGEFDVGPAEREFAVEDRAMRVLDPSSKGTLPMFSVNHAQFRTRLFSVTAEDFKAYARFRHAWDSEGKTTTPPGKLVVNKVQTTNTSPDELVETPVDLTPALKGGVGHVLVIAEPLVQPRRREDHIWYRQWVQVTKLGLTTVHEHEEGVAWVTELASGLAAPGVGIAIDGKPSGTTGPDGLARFLHPAIGSSGDSIDSIVATRGDDSAFIAHGWPYGSLYRGYAMADAIRWLTFDDRKLYKPGEEVHLKGWIRRVGMQKGGDVTLPSDQVGRELRFVAYDGRHNEIAKGTTKLDASLGFDLAWKLPDSANLGTGSVHLDLGASSTTHDYQIEEFRRPEFEVSLRTSEGPHQVGKHAIATVAAKYYSGGGLPNAQSEWQVTSSETNFTPPNRGDYVFGRQRHGFWYGYHRSPGGSEQGSSTEHLTGRTGPDGSHRVRIDFDGLEPSFPRTLSLSATVTDVNRQAWSAGSSILVHPADVYVGLRLAKGFVRAGEVIRADAVVADLDGKGVAGRKVTVRSARLVSEQKGAEWEEKELDVETCSFDSVLDASKCELKTREGGLHRVTARVTDVWGRRNETRIDVYVLGDSPQDRDLKGEHVEIVSDKKEYGGGDTAELLIMAPFAPAQGLLTLERSGVVRTVRFAMSKTAETLAVKLEPGWTPNVNASVRLVGTAPRENESGELDPSLPRRPAFATGDIGLSIPPRDRSITVKVTPREDKVDPSSQVSVGIDFTRAGGEPASLAEAAVAVVDESILALTAYALPDPLALFYPGRPPATLGFELRDSVRVAAPTEMKGLGLTGTGEGGGGRGGATVDSLVALAGAPAASAAPAPGMARSLGEKSRAVVTLAEVAIMGRDDSSGKFGAGGVFGARNASAPIALRTDFRPLVAFLPRVSADARGHADVSFKLPDSLTRYRIMVVAVRGGQEFGKGEGTVTARLPLMVRPSPPRFLNYGDAFELPVVLQNQTDKPLPVAIAARASNATLADARGRRVTVPANDRVEVRLPARAARPGRARFQLATASGARADASEVDLPVWTPATTEAFATYGVVDQGAVAQTVKMPGGVVTEFGGLEITTSSTALQGLTDAVLYLVHYPYDCAEQRASRVLAIAALKDVLGAFKAKGMPSTEAMLASMVTDLAELKARQNGSGGWGFWRSQDAWPYVTLHVTHALARAEKKGFAVDREMRARALSYLQRIESHIPAYYSPESRRSLIAYSLFVRELMGNPDPARARRLLAEAGALDKTSMEALGWLLPTLDGDRAGKADAARIMAFLANRVTETSGAAHFTSSYSDGAEVLLHSDRRDDGVLLESLIRVDPKNTVIPKIVTGLLAHRKKGRWASTNENAFILLALDRYFNTYEKVTPDFVARAWLGQGMVGEHAFKGHTTERDRIDVPMSFLASQGDAPQSLVLGKDGPGRLYYRVGMQYAPRDLLPPADHGFVITRIYEPVDDPGKSPTREKPADVRRDSDGTWRVRAGSKVRVRVTMVAPARRYHVALVDPLPAGLEPMNAALATTGPIPEDQASRDQPGKNPWWWGRWYEHENMRDERVEAFASLLWEGVHEYVYVARATTPGVFMVPPPRAEEMYMPETFGRGAGDRLIVE